MRRASIRAGFISVAVVAAAALGAVALVISLSGKDAPEPPRTRGITPMSGPVVQTYSAYCQTQQGVCVLPSAQPIGSTCTCPDGSSGRVIP